MRAWVILGNQLFPPELLTSAKGQARLGLAVRLLDRVDAQRRQRIVSAAERFLARATR